MSVCKYFAGAAVEEFAGYRKELDSTLSRLREASSNKSREMELQIAERDSEIGALSDRLRQICAELESVRSELDASSAKLAGHESETRRLQEMLEAERVRHRIEMETQIDERDTAMQRLADQLRHKNAELESVGKTVAKHETEIQRLHETLEAERVKHSMNAKLFHLKRLNFLSLYPCWYHLRDAPYLATAFPVVAARA